MNLHKIGIKTESKPSEQQDEVVQNLVEEVKQIPDDIFKFVFHIDGKSFKINLRDLLEIEVNELDELTIANLRVQLEQIASLRTTIGKAYEQALEDFGKFNINYDIWFAKHLNRGREQYWTEQNNLRVKFGFAASGMKSPTQEDVRLILLTLEDIQKEYKEKELDKLSIQKRINSYKKIDEILGSRGYELKTILDTRIKQNG